MTLPVNRSGSYTWAHDLDGDGDLDLSVVDEEADSLFVFYNGGKPTEVGDPGRSPSQAHAMQISPNPARLVSGDVLITVSLPGVGGAPTARIVDASGRLVRKLTVLPGNTAAPQFRWDGLDTRGTQVPAGRYTCVIPLSDRVLTRNVVLLP